MNPDIYAFVIVLMLTVGSGLMTQAEGGQDGGAEHAREVGLAMTTETRERIKAAERRGYRRAVRRLEQLARLRMHPADHRLKAAAGVLRIMEGR